MTHLMEKLTDGQREALKPSDFVFPARRDYPIQSAKQAKYALTFAQWPENKKDWGEVWKAVKKRWPKVAKGFKGGRFWKESVTMSNLPGVTEKLESMRDLVAEAKGQQVEPPEHHDSVAALFASDGADDLSETAFRKSLDLGQAPGWVKKIAKAVFNLTGGRAGDVEQDGAAFTVHFMRAGGLNLNREQMKRLISLDVQGIASTKRGFLITLKG